MNYGQCFALKDCPFRQDSSTTCIGLSPWLQKWQKRGKCELPTQIKSPTLVILINGFACMFISEISVLKYIFSLLLFLLKSLYHLRHLLLTAYLLLIIKICVVQEWTWTTNYSLVSHHSQSVFLCLVTWLVQKN